MTSSLEFPEAQHEAERAKAGFLDWPCTWPGTGFPSLELENGAHPGRALAEERSDSLGNLSSGPLRGWETEHKSKGMIDRVMRLQLRERKCWGAWWSQSLFRAGKNHKELKLQTPPFTGGDTVVQSAGRSARRHTANCGHPELRTQVFSLEAFYCSRSSRGGRE